MFQYSKLIETHDKNVKEKRGEKGEVACISLLSQSLLVSFH